MIFTILSQTMMYWCVMRDFTCTNFSLPQLKSINKQGENSMKKLLVITFTTLFIFGLMSSTVVPTYANKEHHKFHEHYDKLDAKSKEKVDTILSSLKEDLEKLGIDIKDPKHEQFEKLDEKAKEQVKEIIEDLEEGDITKEEADKKLAEFGVNSTKEGHCKIFENLDEATKSKAKEIFKQMKDGKITKDEADKKFQELGIEMPKHPMQESYEKLDKKTKAKVKARVEKAKAEFVKLKVPFPKKFEYLLQ